MGWNYSFDADGRKVAERKLHALDQSESYAMDSLGRLTQFQRGSLLGVNVTTPSPIGLQARNWSLDHANNWANYTSTQGGATSFASRNHTVTNELVQQVAASNTSYVYDANGNLVTDGVNSYKWDFKNRLREVWTTSNGTADEIIAKYWYDAENRRVRKQTFQDQSMVDYYVDGMREIQETATCTGIPLRQYVHGPILDEVLLKDELLPDYVASLVSRCNSDGMHDDLVESIVECKPDSPGGLSWPPIGAGASDSCGPCNYEAYGELLELDVWVLSGLTADCSVCIQPITSLIPYVEGGPTPSCVTCYTIGLHLLTGTPPEFLGAQASECQPCGPEVLAWYSAPNANPTMGGGADFDCLPCEAWDGVTFTVPPGGSSNPPVCGVKLAGRIYYHQNEQQSVFAVTNATGVVLEGYAFDPYGATIVFKPGTNGVVDFGGDDVVAGVDASALSVWTYTGRRHDAESGLLYYRTRYLDSEMGRFISRDTIGVWGDPNSLGNAYTYCSGLPQACRDPTGMWGWVLIGAIVGAVAATIIEVVKQSVETIVTGENKFDGCALLASAAGGVVSGVAYSSGAGIVAASATGAAAAATENTVRQGCNKAVDFVEGKEVCTFDLGSLAAETAAGALTAGASKLTRLGRSANDIGKIDGITSGQGSWKNVWGTQYSLKKLDSDRELSGTTLAKGVGTLALDAPATAVANESAQQTTQALKASASC